MTFCGAKTLLVCSTCAPGAKHLPPSCSELLLPQTNTAFFAPPLRARLAQISSSSHVSDLSVIVLYINLAISNLWQTLGNLKGNVSIHSAAPCCLAQM